MIAWAMGNPFVVDLLIAVGTLGLALWAGYAFIRAIEKRNR